MKTKTRNSFTAQDAEDAEESLTRDILAMTPSMNQDNRAAKPIGEPRLGIMRVSEFAATSSTANPIGTGVDNQSFHKSCSASSAYSAVRGSQTLVTTCIHA
jgi:hypothetical protein